MDSKLYNVKEQPSERRNVYEGNDENVTRKWGKFWDLFFFFFFFAMLPSYTREVGKGQNPKKK